MTALTRHADRHGTVIPVAMLVAALVILVAWPLRQWSVLPVASLLGLAPGVHAVLMRGRLSRRPVLWGAVAAGAVAILPWIVSALQSIVGGLSCSMTFTPMAIPAAVAVALAGAGTYALATLLAVRLATPGATPGRIVAAFAASVSVMAVGVLIWIQLYDLVLAQSPIVCS